MRISLQVENGENKTRPPWREIDRGLENLPTAFCCVGNNMSFEYVYVIDLDNEFFSINNHVYFDLWNIPHDRWVQAFTVDNAGRISFSSKSCPEGSFSFAIDHEYFNDTGESDKYNAISQQYIYSTVKPIGKSNVSSQISLPRIMAILLFEKMTFYRLHFWKYLPGWSHEHFAFREVAFAILSFATGQYYFDERERFHGSECDGYLIDRNEGGNPKLMPLFGSGCHDPNQEPGTAPPGSIYWFDNVLISLVPNTVLENDTEAVLAKAIE